MQNSQIILEQSGLPINIHSVGFQNSQQNIEANATGMQTVTFSTRKRSVKSVMTTLRVNNQLTQKLCNSSSGFKNNNDNSIGAFNVNLISQQTIL